MADIAKDNKADLLHELNVNSRIKYLEEELSNAQADKEFVWSLWRQLQSSNPDLTSAIGAVVQREKEKYDIKERQAFECLKAKNEEIERLKFSMLTQQTELSQLNEKLKSNDLKHMDTEKELDYLRMNTKTYEDKEHMYEQILRGKDDKYEKALCDFNSEKDHLFIKIKDLVNELAKYQEDASQAKVLNFDFYIRIFLLYLSVWLVLNKTGSASLEQANITDRKNINFDLIKNPAWPGCIWPKSALILIKK